MARLAAAIPSISALPEHAPDVAAAAAWLVARLTAAGLDNVAALPTHGAQPVVRCHGVARARVVAMCAGSSSGAPRRAVG
jgi:hypothetical protein